MHRLQSIAKELVVAIETILDPATANGARDLGSVRQDDSTFSATGTLSFSKILFRDRTCPNLVLVRIGTAEQTSVRRCRCEAGGGSWSGWSLSGSDRSVGGRSDNGSRCGSGHVLTDRSRECGDLEGQLSQQLRLLRFGLDDRGDRVRWGGRIRGRRRDRSRLIGR